MQNRFCVWIACLYLCFFAPLVCAADLAAVPELTSLLVDQAGALNENARETVLLRLKEIQGSGQAQVAILISGGIHSESLAEYSLRVADSWKLGRAGHDDGLLILVIPSINAARIEVGYGLEGEIPDARASQWLDDLLPAIKNRELGDGLLHLLDQIEGVLPKTGADIKRDDNLLDRHPEWKLPFVLVVFSPFALFPLFMGRWGALISGPALAAFLGGAALMLWHSRTAAYAAGGLAFLLPFLWALNSYVIRDSRRGNATAK